MLIAGEMPYIVRKTKEQKKFDRIERNNFYHSTVWRKARKHHLINEPFCRKCLQKGLYVKAVYVDHIIPIRKGGEFLNDDNLQSLCRKCNAIKTQKDRMR